MQDIIAFKEKLQTRFAIKESDINDYLGLSIEYNQVNRTLTCDCTSKVVNFLKKYGTLASHTRDTPMDNRTKLSKRDENEPMCDQHLYRQLIGILMYIAVACRPDILFAINKCSQYMQSPADRHLLLIYDIIAYLKIYTDMKITYTGSSDTNNSNRLICYTDASHGDNDDRRSTGGYLIYCNGGPVAWSVYVQDEASGGGPSESEYKSIYRLGAEARHLSQLLIEIGIYKFNLQQNNNTHIPIMYGDNTASISFTHDNSSSSLLRHTQIKYRAVHEWIANNYLTLQYVGTKFQWADIFTKPLDKLSFHRCLAQILTHVQSLSSQQTQN
jgi:hypothetical protein